MSKSVWEGIVIRVVATIVAAILLITIGKLLGIAALGGMAVKRFSRSNN
jgi:hypothetical protein